MPRGLQNQLPGLWC